MGDLSSHSLAPCVHGMGWCALVGGIGRIGHLGESLEASAETPAPQQPLPFFKK